MTELINEKKCRDCAHHTGDACDNSNSDHYGHMITTWHQACSVFADLQETPSGVEKEDEYYRNGHLYIPHASLLKSKTEELKHKLCSYQPNRIDDCIDNTCSHYHSCHRR